MSKAISAAFTKLKNINNLATKFSASAVEGHRIVPSRTKDADFEVRIDAGRYDPTTKALNVVLQVNSQAKSPALKEWARKNSTHAKLATATFKTDAEDKEAEALRMLEELEEQAKNNIT
ncbi:MAG: hypothetical protein Q9184_004220 [Pyrenodesmia sp. 2 TL-2023]